MWHSRPPRDPPTPLHGKCHLKFPFWLSAPVPMGNIRKAPHNVSVKSLAFWTMFIATSSFEPCVNAKVGILPGYLCKFGCQDSRNIGSFKWIAPFPLTIFFCSINHNREIFWSGHLRGRSITTKIFLRCYFDRQDVHEGDRDFRDTLPFASGAATCRGILDSLVSAGLATIFLSLKIKIVFCC